MPNYQCKHCHEEINYIQYKADATEYGSVYLDSGNYERDESQTDGNYFYSCPECEYDSSDKEDIYENVDENEDDEEETNDLSEQPNTDVIHGPLITRTQTNINRCHECGNPTMLELCIVCNNIVTD